MHGADASAVEQVKHEVEIVFDDLTVWSRLANHAGTAGIEVERAVRNETGQAGYRIEPRASVITALLVELDAFAHERLIAGHGMGRGSLADRRRTRRHLRLQLVDGRDQRCRTGGIADPPSGHGIGL